MSMLTMKTMLMNQSAYKKLIFWSQIIQYLNDDEDNDDIMNDQTMINLHFNQLLVSMVIQSIVTIIHIFLYL